MALSDFIKKLEEQDDSNIIYSKKPEDTIKVIPPTNNQTSIKILPPQEEKKPTVIKFKLASKPKVESRPEVEDPKNPKIEKTFEVKNPNSNILTVNNREEEIDKLFNLSETPINLKEKWIENYHKAMASKKDSLNIQKMRAGRFTITNEGKIEILSDYVTANKSSENILRDKWIKNY